MELKTKREIGDTVFINYGHLQPQCTVREIEISIFNNKRVEESYLVHSKDTGNIWSHESKTFSTLGELKKSLENN